MTRHQISTTISPETRRKLDELCQHYGTQREVVSIAIDRLHQIHEKERHMKIYIYSTDLYGNPGPYYTTQKSLEADIAEIMELDSVELHEGYHGNLYNDDGHKVAELATPDVVACYDSIDDPLGLAPAD